MESNGDIRGGLLSAGGVLSIIGGIFQIVSVGSLVVSFFFPDWLWYILDTATPLRFIPFITGSLLQYIQCGSLEGPGPVLFAVGAGVLAIVAIVGGISAIRRNRFGLSLAGAICALPSLTWGVLAVIFVVLGKREFRAKA
jgi:hypothetical protein